MENHFSRPGECRRYPQSRGMMQLSLRRLFMFVALAALVLWIATMPDRTYQAFTSAMNKDDIVTINSMLRKRATKLEDSGDYTNHIMSPTLMDRFLFRRPIYVTRMYNHNDSSESPSAQCEHIQAWARFGRITIFYRSTYLTPLPQDFKNVENSENL